MNPRNLTKYSPAAGGLAITLFLWLTFYTVPETDFVLVTQFGKPLYVIGTAGLHAKWFFQTASYFDRRLRGETPQARQRMDKQSVYARMRAERGRIARQYRAEGEEQALKARAEADRQREEILSIAYKEAEKTRGEGDAESTRIYGQAYSRSPKFYKLMRTLEAYKKILDDKTTAILGSDSELLKILTHGEKGAE